jgi:hypothetical protein
MPITLNHSNIGVQYSTGSNYIIETVKSDLYRRNEIVDTIVRDNIQVAPVTPSIYIENGTNNVYAVESYTYSGSANTADFTRVFPKNTTGDILVVGGGGAGGTGHGGGGGGGSVIYTTGLSFEGEYNIKVGKGGIPAATRVNNGGNGNDSFVVKNGTNLYLAKGGGGGGRAAASSVGNDGGSGGGGQGNATTGVGGLAVSTNIPTGVYGFAGGRGNTNQTLWAGGGGGGCETIGSDAILVNTSQINGGNGGNGKQIPITGNSLRYGGGGGGSVSHSGVNNIAGNGGLGGGGNGGLIVNGFTGTDGLGGGGGGGGQDANGDKIGGTGGSGIVIIRYLLGTIPANNLLTTEPSITPATFTESIRSFIHSGGAEAQTTYTITVGRDTICDILIVGGGGGGSAGGGGAGGYNYITNRVLIAGTYTVKVGAGGTAVASPSTRGNDGQDSFISLNNVDIARAYKGGGGANNYQKATAPDGIYGSTGGCGHDSGNGQNTFPAGTLVGGNIGAVSTYQTGNGYQTSGGGGGAGGVGQVGIDGNVNNANTGALGGAGGIGLQNSITGTATYYAGGGAGGTNINLGSNTQANRPQGGLGGGGNGNRINAESGTNGTPNTGGGGGGSDWEATATTSGGSGIVIIKVKSLAGPILEGITHKILNFVYNNDNLVAWYRFNGDYLDSSGNGHNLTNVGTVIQSTHIIEGQAVEFDSTDYLEFPATINPYTIWNNGKGITFSCWVRFTAHGLWARLIDFQTAANTNNGIFFSVKSAPATGASALYADIGGTKIFTYSNWSNSLITTLGVWHHFVWSIDVNGKWDIYLNNVRINGTETANIPNISYNLRYINKSAYPDSTWGGQMDDFRIYDRALSATDVSLLYNKTYPVPSNTYTLNFPVPTIADINNNSNIVLRGAYDLALSTSNALIIPKAGQYIPQPTTFTNYSVERMYPPVRNFSAATTTLSGQTYGNGTYVVSYSSTYGSGYDPFKCFNTSDIIGGAWPAGRYTAGVFNSTSFIVSGYLGDWLKIQLPVAIKLTRFEFLMRTDSTQGIRERSPKNFKIYGSNDNITWVELVNKTDAVYDTSFRYIQLTQDITTAYTYYGLVVNKLLGSTADILNFDEWYIYGQEVLPSSLSIRYNLLNPTQDPIGAQWTYNTSNINVYHMGSVGIGTTSPEYQLDVSGSLNAKTLMYNGSSVNSLGLSVGMIAQVQHLTYTKMEVKDNTGWDAINEDLTSGFVIKITPKSSLSKMLVNLIVFIGMSTSVDNAWWGIKLYRKIGTGSWTEITGCNGTETGSAAATAGTPVWISNNTGMVTYNSSITNASGTYLDSPNTTATVYYTAYWNQRLGDNPSTTGQMFLNRASSQDDAYRPAPSSSWTVEEIWYG